MKIQKGDTVYARVVVAERYEARAAVKIKGYATYKKIQVRNLVNLGGKDYLCATFVSKSENHRGYSIIEANGVEFDIESEDLEEWTMSGTYLAQEAGFELLPEDLLTLNVNDVCYIRIIGAYEKLPGAWAFLPENTDTWIEDVSKTSILTVQGRSFVKGRVLKVGGKYIQAIFENNKIKDLYKERLEDDTLVVLRYLQSLEEFQESATEVKTKTDVIPTEGKTRTPKEHLADLNRHEYSTHKEITSLKDSPHT